MVRKTYAVIGVMSGTSCDGIDLAYVNFELKNQQWKYVFKDVETSSYGDYWKAKLSEAHTFSEQKIIQLNNEYTAYLAKEINAFITKNKIQHLDAVCSHGHTVFHQPERNFTLQIGNLPKLADLLQQNVVCDFRKQDVKLGGQGAPLVPIGDQLLFSDYDACVNLGGFANISLGKNAKRIAYDICPVNTVLNKFAQKCGKEYDDGGNLAKSGTVDYALLEQLNSLDFYQQNHPKSLGVEWVNSKIFPVLESAHKSPKTILATFTEHVACQLSAVFPSSKTDKILITGGGAYNRHLIALLKEKIAAQIIIPDDELINYKEALIFGFLGVLKLSGEINVLKSVTGAQKNHSSGVVYLPQN